MMKLKLFDIKDKASIDFIYDYQDKIKDHEDILSIEPANIHIDIYHESNSMRFVIYVKVNMELECAKTLKPVNYHMEFEDEIIFSPSHDADFPIEDPIEISDIIFGYILSEKPYTIYHPDAHDVKFEKEKSPHPAFADLDKIMKK
jgi:uncharacterized metal-binding protein YceD (DUF177 family)